MTTTDHLAALDDDPVVRADALRMLARVDRLRASGTTDQAPDVLREPAASYVDPARWADELAAIHRSVPLPLALSCELAEPGAYKAIDVAGTPVLLTRTADGEARAMLNVCRHRGAEVVPAGSGVAPRLVCPYHSWCYALDGALTSVEDEATFGGVDRSALALLPVPVQERAGLVFVGLTPGRPLDLDAWLGPELGHLLDALDLAGCFHHSTRVLDGPNWKVVLDGYLESYHVGTAHQQSVLLSTMSNMATFDAFGPHMRNCFAYRTSADASDGSDASDAPDVAAIRASVADVYWLFPGLNISGAWGAQIAVSLVLPGRTWDVSRTEQHIILRDRPADDTARQSADVKADRLREIVLDEDYTLAEGVQRSLGALAGQDVLFGRNEPGVQHFHRTIDCHLAAAGRQ
jgi:phenylpropionate dioxygenase-like ring-hydroxylating dioxygenase large terminal subunit